MATDEELDEAFCKVTSACECPAVLILHPSSLAPRPSSPFSRGGSGGR